MFVWVDSVHVRDIVGGEGKVKALLIFLIIFIALAIVGGLLAGFVFGIVKRGKQLKRQEAQLKAIKDAADLWDDIDSPLAAKVKGIIK